MTELRNDATAGPVDDLPARRRLLRFGGSPGSRVIVAVLCAALGFALVAAVHTHRAPASLQTARQEDLVRVLDALSAQSDRLRDEIDQLQAAKARLATSGDQAQAALDEARREADALAVLAGTAPATGPGVTIDIDDPSGRLQADTLLDAVEELRDAGAEAMQVGPPVGPAVRIVASTAFVDPPGSPGGEIEVDGRRLSPPYHLVAIGDGPTLAAAMGIPGGVVDTVRRLGGTVSVAPSGRVSVTALRSLDDPRYARPAPQDSAGTGH